jgi:hypothetical protein
MHMNLLNYNGMEQGLAPAPFLINNPIYKGDRAMTETTIPNNSLRINIPEYLVWAAMKRRCYNPNVKGFKNYGGRGIRVCDEWIASFDVFISDMGKRPSKKHTIDRIRNSGDYEPGNCKWSTRFEQANNKRDNVNITVNGATKTIAGWSRETGLSESAIRWRLNNGINPEKAVTTKSRLNAIPFLVYDKLTGEYLGSWEIQSKCAKDLGISNRHICSVLHGHRKSTGGYTMEYI